MQSLDCAVRLRMISCCLHLIELKNFRQDIHRTNLAPVLASKFLECKVTEKENVEDDISKQL
jgi:hypothetical protein